LVKVFLFNDENKIILCFLGVYIVIEGVYQNKGYHNKT